MDISPFENKVYWVNPDQIVYFCEYSVWSEWKGRMVGEFHYSYDSNKIVGGYWDYVAMSKRFDESRLYRALKSVFIDNKSWEETEFYIKRVAQIKKGNPNIHETELEFKNKFKNKIRPLYEDIKHNGYKQRRELVNDPKKMKDEITVNIGRFGDLLFNNGRHRLSIAKLLELERVPIRIVVYHEKWTGNSAALRLLKASIR